MFRLLARVPRSVEDDPGSWSPFARNDSADRDAVARALLAALEHEDCTLGALTPARYSELRRRRPQMGLPRTTTVTAVCGTWQRAVEAAEHRAAGQARRTVFA